MCRKNLVKKVATAALSLLLVLSQFNVNAFAASASLELLYNFGGCQNDLYTAEAYWVDPIVKDIYKNGKNQIIFGNYSVIVIDAATGKEMWRVNGGYDRTKAYQVTGGDVGKVNKIITADIDADGFEEIIVAHGNGWISVLSHDGYMKPGWPKQIKYSDGTAVLRDVRSLHVTSLKNDGKYQIIAGAATNRAENVWVFDSTGNLLPGWPQLSKDQNAYYLSDFKNPGGAFSYGVFMDGVMAGDITGDGIKEILVAIDDAYICAYDINGKLVPANAQVFGGRTWGKVGLFEDYSYENSLSADRKADHNWNQGQGLSSAQGRS
ncbi:hypothetical protein LJB89_01905, partial [Tyzzerella sp. OttesenSCG-928-J15]|nr:hypothetical protein [Tyzzerella sp. OttesenSCG-928-J15]